MNIKKKLLVSGLLATGFIPILGGNAQASAIIINPAGTVAMGINDDGSLNVESGNITANANATGLAFNFGTSAAPVWRDATAPACFCEGWGVSVNETDSGFANITIDSGSNNLAFGPITSTATTATTVTSLTSKPGVEVTHSFAPSASAPGVLFEVEVTVQNTTGSDLTDVKYVRVMDWDVPNTEFNEIVTIEGTASATLLEKSGLNGFNSADPLAPYDDLILGCTDIDCTDIGPDDLGAYFRFNFGTLAGTDDLTTPEDETSLTFSIFYGAASSESLALAAISTASLELFSLGQSNGGEISGSPATFIFGFSGVSGTPTTVPVSVPVPGLWGLLGIGLFGMAAMRRRKQVQ